MIHSPYRTYLRTWFSARRDKAETRAWEKANNIFIRVAIYGGSYVEKDDPSSREDRYRELDEYIGEKERKYASESLHIFR